MKMLLSYLVIVLMEVYESLHEFATMGSHHDIFHKRKGNKAWPVPTQVEVGLSQSWFKKMVVIIF